MNPNGNDLRRPPAWFPLAVLAAGLLLLGAVFVQLQQTPCIHFDRWEETDMNYFSSWANRIAEGDILSRTVHPPLHSWHLEVADSYFQSHPDVQHSLSARCARGGGGLPVRAPDAVG